MVPVKIGRKTHKLKLTLGSVEDIPADDTNGTVVPFMPAQTLNALASSVYSMRDVRVVVEAGLEGGEVKLDYDAVFDALGMKATGKVALDLLLDFFGIDQSGKADAAPDQEQKTDQTGSE